MQGSVDSALKDSGHCRGREVRRALATGRGTAVYASDLQRAWHTGQRIAGATGAPLQPEPGLRERGFGLFEGKTFQEIEQAWPEQASQWRRRVPEWVPPEGGESLLLVRERVAETVQRIAARHPGELIVLVAHGGVLDAIYRLATRQALDAPRTWKLPNAAINRLLWSPEGLAVIGWAETGPPDVAARCGGRPRGGRCNTTCAGGEKIGGEE